MVERSKTSLPAFCQHFTNKDEVLFAVLEEIMAHSTQAWRTGAASFDSAAALRMLIEKVKRATGIQQAGQQGNMMKLLTVSKAVPAWTLHDASARGANGIPH